MPFARAGRSGSKPPNQIKYATGYPLVNPQKGQSLQAKTQRPRAGVSFLRIALLDLLGSST